MVILKKLINISLHNELDNLAHSAAYYFIGSLCSLSQFNITNKYSTLRKHNVIINFGDYNQILHKIKFLRTIFSNTVVPFSDITYLHSSNEHSFYGRYITNDTFYKQSLGAIFPKIHFIVPTYDNVNLNYRLAETIFLFKFFFYLSTLRSILYENGYTLINSKLENFLVSLETLYKSEDSVFQKIKYDYSVPGLLTGNTLSAPGDPFKNILLTPIFKTMSLLDYWYQLLLSVDSDLYNYPTADSSIVGTNISRVFIKENWTEKNALYAKQVDSVMTNMEKILNPLIDEFFLILKDELIYVNSGNKIQTLTVFDQLFRSKNYFFFDIFTFLEYSLENLGQSESLVAFDILHYMEILKIRFFKNFVNTYLKNTNLFNSFKHEYLLYDIINVKYLANLSSFVREFNISKGFSEVNLAVKPTLYISEVQLYEHFTSLSNLETFFYEKFISKQILNFIDAVKEHCENNNLDFVSFNVEQLFNTYLHQNKILEESEYYHIIQMLYDK